MCDFLAVVDRQNSGISLCSCYKDIVYKHKNAESCNLQVAGQNLKYARTVNAKLILRKKTVSTASRKTGNIFSPRKLFVWS